MAERKHFISIWFFIGLQLAIYGALILGAGIYELLSPSAAEQTVMANLHPALWWGALLLGLGIAYSVGFRPGKRS